MPDIGSIATDQEYALMVQGFAGAAFDAVSKEAIIIRAVEAAIRREVNFSTVAVTVANEEYSIEFPIVQDDIIVSRRTSFMLKRAPISTFASLLIVTERNATTGLPSATSTIPRNSYHVELSTGIVRELNWTFLQGYLLQLWPSFSFPAGTMNLLANYAVTAPEADLSAEIKMVAFMMANRLFKQFQNNRFDVTSMSMDGMSTSFVAEQFTKQELGYLKPFKRHLFPSFH